MAQETTAVKPVPAITVEIGGPGGYASVNFDQPFFQYRNTSFAIRAGLSTFHLKDYQNNFNPDLILPISVRAYAGQTHQLEIGAGQVFTSIVVADAEANKKRRKQNLHSQLALGYRYAPAGKRWMASISYTPLIEHSHGLRHWAALSVSYKISKE
jgi:hypothetical protein